MVVANRTPHFVNSSLPSFGHPLLPRESPAAGFPSTTSVNERQHTEAHLEVHGRRVVEAAELGFERVHIFLLEADHVLDILQL